MSSLLHKLIFQSAEKNPDAEAIRFQQQKLSYSWLARQIERVAHGLIALGLGRRERIAVYLDKRPETVIAMFAAAAAGTVFVPVNPLLKPEQVAYILRDCNVRILITSRDRLLLLKDVLAGCHDLRQAVVIGDGSLEDSDAVLPVAAWDSVVSRGDAGALHRSIDSDMVAILYTSGSTGKPKGVVLSHRNMVAGAISVASYLQNSPDDRILSVLPFSFDYGFSQLSTAFLSGACVVLMNYLLARDVITMAERERISGLAAVPPLWIQLAQLEWPPHVQHELRYITNSGGAMPRAVVEMLQAKLPKTEIFLMYGLTEAFRSTYLPPTELERRPDSIGKAIPNTEILVVRPDGSLCAPGEPGELVHRGALVALGYWNDPAKTTERFRPAPGQLPGLTLPEIAVWSGDTVRMDEAGFLYFIGRKDDMIKTSGYRVSPTEIEEVIYSTGLVGEAVALGIPHPILGQAIMVVATPLDGTTLDVEALMAECKRCLPTFMVPGSINMRRTLPRNPNGKIDRKQLAEAFADHFSGATG
jgi:acyl-CoA ligase (AMP-forming) (exosortase A-associated)